MISTPSLVVRVITVTCFVFSTLIAPVMAYAKVGVRIKTAPVKYHLTPESLPQIPLNVFYNQRYFNQFDPEDKALKIAHQDYSLTGIDGLSLSITRHYDSRQESDAGMFGNGWSWALDSHIIVLDNEQLQLKGLDGEWDTYTATGPDEFVSFESGKEILQRMSDGYHMTSVGGLFYQYDVEGRLVLIRGKNNQPLKLIYSNSQLVGIQDTVGRNIKFSYNALNRIDRILLPSGRSIRYRYDADGYLSQATSPLGETVRYYYEDQKLVKVDYPEARWARFSYDKSSGDLIRSEAAGGYTVQYRYENENSVQRTISTGPQGNVTVYEYSDNGLTVIGPEGGMSRLIWHDQFSRLPISYTSPGGKTTKFEYNDQGKLVLTTNALGAQLKLEYDQNDRLKRMESPRGAELFFHYDPRGNLVRYQDANNDELVLKYNDNGTVTSARMPGETVQLEYDDLGQITRVQSTLGGKQAFQYDDLGRLTSVSSESHITSLEYFDLEHRARIASNVGDWMDVYYDNAGLPTRLEDRLGRVTQFKNNEWGVIGQSINPAGEIARYQYDQRGNLIEAIVPGGGTHRYQYDALSRLKTLTDSLGETLDYTYTLDGQLATEQVSGRSPVEYQYDAIGRLKTVLYGMQLAGQFDYNADNQMIEAATATMATQFGRNLAGELELLSSHRVDADAGGVLTSNEGVQASGEVQEISNYFTVERNLLRSPEVIQYPDESRVTYAYDDGGQLVNLSIDEKHAIEIDHNKENQQQVVTYPNQVKTIYHYNDKQAIDKMEVVGPNGDRLLSHDYQYSEDGKLSSYASQYTGEVSQEYQYSYDELGQLIVVENTGNSITEYQYDADGNRTQKNIIKLVSSAEPVTDLYSYSAGRLSNLNEVSFEYDASGNLMKKASENASAVLEYTARNELKSYHGALGKLVYEYDALGHRIGRKTDDSQYDYQYLFGHRLTEKRIGTDESRNYYFSPGIDRIVAMRDKQGTDEKIYYFHLDRFNSVVLVTDEGGSVVNRYEYGAFGETTIKQELVRNNVRYTARFQDENSGYYDLRSRFYDPELGRFISEDSFPAFVGSSQSQNRYVYVYNDPLQYRDPNGEWLHVIVGAAIGAAINSGVQIAANVSQGKTWHEGAAGAFVSGGMVGGLAAATGGASLAGSVAIGAASGAVGEVVNVGVNNLVAGNPNGVFDGLSAQDVAISAAFSGAFSGLSTVANGLAGANPRGIVPMWARGNNMNSIGIGQGSVINTQIPSLGRLGTNTVKILAQDTTAALGNAASNQASAAASSSAGSSSSNSNASDSNTSDSSTSNPSASDSSTFDSSASDSNTTDSDAADSNTTDSDAADSNTTDSNATDSDAADSNTTDSNATDSNAADSNTTDSNAADSDAADSNAADSNAADSDATDSTAVDSQALVPIALQSQSPTIEGVQLPGKPTDDIRDHNDDRRTHNDDRRTHNDDRRTHNDDRRTHNDRKNMNDYIHKHPTYTFPWGG